MSAYNRLRAEAHCPKCGQTSEQVIQFKFGDAWLDEYTLGESLRWGGNDIGRPGIKKVVVLGAGEECPVCHSSGEDFSVSIERDVITAVEPAREDPLPTTEGDLYAIVEDD